MSKLCVTIAVKDIQELSKSIDEALKVADLIEIRFDYIAKDDLDKALEVASDVKDRAIFTCRAKDEGGRFEGNEEDRLEVIKRLIDSKPMLVDIEYNTLLKHELNWNGILVSWHDFKHTPSNSVLYDQMNKMRRYSKNIKIVTFANNIMDNREILQLYNQNDGINLIAFCMGEFGRTSRVLSMLYGSPFIYVTLNKAVAAGQFTVYQLDRVLREIRVDHFIIDRVASIIAKSIDL